MAFNILLLHLILLNITAIYAERRHRHIVETGLSLLTHAHLPLSFWTSAFTTATYLINRLPTPTLHGKSPYHCLFGSPPNYLKLRCFGCLCYPWLKPYTKHKLDPKSTPCIFIGYSKTQSAYHCLNPTTGRIYTSRHVRFIETEFPYPSLTSTSPLPHSSSPDAWCPLPLPILGTPAPALSSPPLGIITRSKNNIHKPNPKYANLTTTSSRPTEPTTVTQASRDPHWKSAMDSEIEALTKLGTWELVPPNPSRNLVKCKWVYRIKYNSDGSLDRYKARLVAKGFQQRPGIDYTETFSPVVRPTTIRTLLALAVTNRWHLRQLDINNAFLQGTLHEEVFMSQPPGYVDPNLPQHVCRLKKAIYGLKQAPRAWYTELTTFLLGLGFTRAVSDTSLFILSAHSIYLIVYVDDIIITGPNSTAITQFVTHLAHRFALKDLGSLSYFLGVEVIPTASGLFLSQRKYILDLLARFGMLEARPAPTPLVVTQSLQAAGPALDAPTDYRAALGGLQYLTLTRPDVAFAVNRLSQYMHKPTSDHWLALKRLLRYLCGTLDKGITIFRDSPLSLHAFSDADWAGDKDDYISTMGHVVFLGRTPLTWCSKKQKSIARSSTEAEYRAVASTTAEVMGIRNLLQELGVQLTASPVIYCDNLSATHLSANPVFHSKMKHLAIAFHFIREQVQGGSISSSYPCSHW